MRTQEKEGERNGPRRGSRQKDRQRQSREGRERERRMKCWEKRQEGEERAGGGGTRENESK